MVGEAYVRVTADTTQMRRALHRAARDSERDMQAFQALIDDVADSQISAVKKRLAGGLVDPKILTRWSKEFKNSSEAAENFRGVINSIRNDFSEMTAKQQKEHLAAINRWEKQAKAAESLAAAEKQRLADEKAALDAAKVRSAEQQRMLVAQQKFAEEGRRQLAKIALAEEKEVAARQQRMAAAQERFVAEARRVQQIELRDAIVHADRMNKAFDSIAEKYSLVFRKKSDGFIFKRSELTSLAAQFEHAGETAGEALARGVRSRVRSIEGAFDSIALRINRSGGFVGTILGKGSRNNFLKLLRQRHWRTRQHPLRALHTHVEVGQWSQSTRRRLQGAEAGRSLVDGSAQRSRRAGRPGCCGRTGRTRSRHRRRGGRHPQPWSLAYGSSLGHSLRLSARSPSASSAACWRSAPPSSVSPLDWARPSSSSGEWGRTAPKAAASLSRIKKALCRLGRLRQRGVRPRRLPDRGHHRPCDQWGEAGHEEPCHRLRRSHG
jgi:hypothetical protein